MPGPDPHAHIRDLISKHGHYLRNPLPAGPGVCVVCRGPAGESYLRCRPCGDHFRASPDGTADAVVPISYAVKGNQHAHDLAAYKGLRVSEQSRSRLLGLLTLFFADHARCLMRSLGGSPPDHAAVVPSTRGRPGPHPLRLLIGDRLPFPWVPLVATGRGDEGRTFDRDRFAVEPDPPLDLRGKTVLLLDDTWTTGSRMQSASHTLKAAGVAKVAAVTLGRHAKPDWDPWLPLLRTIKDTRFRLDDCALHGTPHPPRS
ncbi:phosphoribosyltransferase [Thermomonospora umbrina]|uniref:Phosphoribosyl transferase-like protein n=1 Tax=Thermomonospora umbrina TaxID=111806 RepID=A0A3D9T1W9_9ACTN|nr:phosphoribosyltransferase [Thermomonospora umbrina]REE98744.1 phosphoribosyl transferase-like protein [Thermomonospora umbrina]